MLLIRTVLKESTIPGIGLGLFADEFIKKGTVTWRFCPNFDQSLEADDMLRLSAEAREQFYTYTYKSIVSGRYILCGDNERFINHSDNPNITEGEREGNYERFSIANRDIEKGEELFCNYYEFDENANKKLSGKEGHTHYNK